MMKQKFEVHVTNKVSGQKQTYVYYSQAEAYANADGLKDSDYEVQVEDKSAEHQAEMKIVDRSKARSFCLHVIDQVAAMNSDIADASKMQLIFGSAAFQGIMLALLTGATKTARDMINVVGPQLYPQEAVTAIVAKMDAYLADEAAQNAPAPTPEPTPEPEAETPQGETPQQ